MKLKHTLILTALTVALSGAFIANAAEEKPAKDATSEKTQPAKKDKRPDSAERTKQEAAEKAEDTCCRNPSPAVKKSPHDHR